MDDFIKHKADFSDGFHDGFNRQKAGRICKWRDHQDVNDGFRCPNPVYSLSYEMGYEFGNLENEIPEGKIDDLFIKFIKMLYTEHHNENNK